MKSQPTTSAMPPVTDPPDAAWHALSIEDVLSRLGASRQGLDAARAAERLTRFGPNAMVRGRRESWLEEFAESFTEPLQLLLILVAVLSFVFGERGGAIAILGVILLSAAVETTRDASRAGHRGAGRAVSPARTGLAGRRRRDGAGCRGGAG